MAQLRAEDQVQLGLQHQRAGRFAEAEVVYRRALSRNPYDANVLQLLGMVFLQSGRIAEAIEHLRRALAIRPDLPEALNNLGVAMEGEQRLEEAEAVYRRAVAIKSDYIEARNNLGNALRKLGRAWESGESHLAAARLRPADPPAYAGLGAAMLDQARLRDALSCYRRRMELLPQSPSAHSDLLFWLLHDPECDARSLFDEHVRWNERHAPNDEATVEASGGASPDRPLRVGYMSADFREHPLTRFIEPVLANHDPAAVVSVCYSDVPRADAVTSRLRSLAGEWRDTAGMSDDKLAALIQQDRIDILVDPTGHMGGNRLPVFARKPAPVQATYLYPHSTGLSAMDWRITDSLADPTGMTEPFHTERLLRLDGCAFCYRPTENSLPVNDPPALEAGRITFGSMNRAAKLNRPLAALWAKLLNAVPGSRLLVLAPGGEINKSVRGLFEREGIAPDRLTLVGLSPRPQYLALMQRIDIALDTFPYAGMTTTCDLLWMGVPVVTLTAPDKAVSRAGASLLGAVGLGELVASTEAEFLGVAAGLASDAPRLRELRRTLQARMEASPLRDEHGQTRKLEAAYRSMWLKSCRRH